MNAVKYRAWKYKARCNTELEIFNLYTLNPLQQIFSWIGLACSDHSVNSEYNGHVACQRKQIKLLHPYINPVFVAQVIILSGKRNTPDNPNLESDHTPPN